MNLENRTDLPEKKLKKIKYIGVVEVSKGIISIKTDRGTSYEMFVTVINELMAAMKEVKDEASLKYFGKHFTKLDKEKKDIILKYPPALKPKITA